MLQQEGFSLIWRKHTQRSLDVSSDIHIFLTLRTRCHCPLDRTRRGSKAKLPLSPSRRVSPALVHYNVIEPSSKPIAIPACTESAKRAHESRLQRIVCVRTRSQHSHRKTGTCVLVTPNEAGECFDVPGEYGRNQFCISRSFHK